MPNFGTYVLFCVWKSEENARDFFKENPFFKAYQKRSTEQFNAYLNSAESHGTWDGIQPFIKNATLAPDKPVLVLTRSSIHINKLWSFWSSGILYTSEAAEESLRLDPRPRPPVYAHYRYSTTSSRPP